MKRIENIFVNRVLNSIENISKLFLLSPFPSDADFSRLKNVRILSFWNFWTIFGLSVYSTLHIYYVNLNDPNENHRNKWVTVTIDKYNKYIGVMLLFTLVMLTLIRHAKTAQVNHIFCEIDDILRNRMGIDINNLKTQRCFYIQVTLLIAVIMISEQNCLMYINTISDASGALNFCMALCIIPMLTTAVFECRIFAYFLLIRERLLVINETINFISKTDLNNNNPNQFDSGVFFIATELGSFRINEKFSNKKKPLEGLGTTSTKSNLMMNKCKLIMKREWKLLKDIFMPNDKKMYVNDLEAAKHQKHHRITHANYHMKLMANAQIIYSKLHEISNLISSAFGIQIIAIISVQFITLTTLMYTFAMKITRLLTENLTDDETLDISQDIWTSLMWIFLFIYKLYSICYSVHSTILEDQKVGHHLHDIGFGMSNINHKLKVKSFQLQYLQRKKNFTPCGLVDIDFGLFTMIIGVVSTYILILIQFDIAQKT